MPIKIDTTQVCRDHEGLYTTRWYVRLPETMVADDLKDPSIWSKVQGGRNPLRVHDELYMVGFASSFAVEARVVQTTNIEAVLALQKIISFPDRLTPMFSDENYKVVPAVDGYGVERKVDGARVGGSFGSEALAIHYIRTTYPAAA